MSERWLGGYENMLNLLWAGVHVSAMIVCTQGIMELTPSEEATSHCRHWDWGLFDLRQRRLNLIHPPTYPSREISSPNTTS